MSTGISHSHTLNDLSSDVDTNLRLLSQNVIELTAPEIINILHYHGYLNINRRKTQILSPFNVS